MSDTIEFLKALSNTPLPIILVVAGILFILLGFAEMVQVKVPPPSKPWLRAIGGILLFVGILFYMPIIIPSTSVDHNPAAIPTPTLTPISSPTPIPTPTPPPTPSPSLEIKIISPKDGDRVPITTTVYGNISGNLQESQYMWLVVHPDISPGQWWPQGGQIIPWKGQWNMQVQFGGEEQTGQRFDIAVILVDKQDNQYYLDYFRNAQQTKNYPGISLPSSANMLDKITVTRI